MIDHLSFIRLVFLAGIICWGNSDSKPDAQKASNQLLDPTSGKYHEFGTRGPCGANMIFYNHPLNKRFGFCDCDQGYKSKYPCSDHPVRRMIYVPNFDQCFPIFSQGPCEIGYWLNFDSESNPKCEPNACLDKESQTKDKISDPVHQFWYFDPLRKSCFRTHTRGYCPVGMTLEVIHNSHIPKCRKKVCYSHLTNFRSFLTCRIGSRYSFFLKGCITSPQTLYYGIG